MRSTNPRVVLDGLVFPESPRWHNGQLWLCDFELWLPDRHGQVLVVDAAGAARTVADQVPATGLGWLPDGRLLLVAGRSLLAVEPDGALTTYADLSSVTAYPCNELMVDASGWAVTGGVDTVGGGIPRATPTELVVVHPDGRPEVADSAMRVPNGYMITPDGGTLIVAESRGQCLTAFTTDADGTLGDKRLWAAVPGMTPDGPCLDQEGCVWFADATGNACVRVAEGGEVKDRVETDQGAFACTLGGDDGRTLFVMTSTFPSGEVFNPRPGRIVAFEADVPGDGTP
jgi:sugar lactone lactonase YvrE